MLFLLIWKIGHWATPELERKFLPGVNEIVGKIFYLIKEKGFLLDIGVSLYRIYVSFFVACIVAVPLGLVMGCFVKVQMTATADAATGLDCALVKEAL